MNTEQLSQIQSWVEGYVDGFRQAPADLPPPLALKLDHTRHVAKNAREIARELEWAPEDVRMAEALGWLHDVGRFSQFAEFGHLHDATSVNHGLRGFEIARDSGILAQLRDGCRTSLLEGIRHHNAKTIPATISAAGLPFLKLIRDADKLDIYRVVAEEIERDGFQELAGLWPHIDLDGPISPRLLNEIRTQRDIDLRHIQSLADFLLLQAFWIYDLHYEPTRVQIRQRRILETLETHLPSDPAVLAVLETIRASLQEEAVPGRNHPASRAGHAG